MPRGEDLPSEIQIVTVKTRNAAIELLARFFREEEFVTPLQHIAENFDRMIADPSCWSALAVDGDTAQAVITVSTVRYVEWGRLGEIGDLYVLPEHRLSQFYAGLGFAQSGRMSASATLDA